MSALCLKGKLREFTSNSSENNQILNAKKKKKSNERTYSQGHTLAAADKIQNVHQVKQWPYGRTIYKINVSFCPTFG